MTDPSTLAGELKKRLRDCVSDMAKHQEVGYPWNWTQASRKSLQDLGIATPLEREMRRGHYLDVCRLTPLGLAVAKHLERDNG